MKVICLIKLRGIAKEHDTTLFTVLFTIYNIFLHKITGQNDIVVGTPSTDRNYQTLENNIGLFVNTLAIKSKINNQETFERLLLQTKDKFLEAYNGKYYQIRYYI